MLGRMGRENLATTWRTSDWRFYCRYSSHAHLCGLVVEQ